MSDLQARRPGEIRRGDGRRVAGTAARTMDAAVDERILDPRDVPGTPRIHGDRAELVRCTGSRWIAASQDVYEYYIDERFRGLVVRPRDWHLWWGYCGTDVVALAPLKVAMMAVQRRATSCVH